MPPPPHSTASHHPAAEHTSDGGETPSVNDATPPPADWPATLGPYRIVKELGRGGMGTVYLAEDTALRRHVALKVMALGVAGRPEARPRFLREARAMAAVKHDHVVTVYAVGEADGTAFLAMELLDGSPLDKWLSATPRPPVGVAVRVAKEVCRGLAAAHVKGLVHRDVKPGNVWLEADTARVKLLDFGLARPADDDQHITASHTVVGTPAYMAPEQARAHAVDGRADLWSVGVLLYRMLSGRLPYEAPTTIALLAAMALDEPPPLAALAPDAPPALVALTMRLLRKAPADRPATAAAVADALQDIERAVAAATPNSLTVPAPRRPRRAWVAAGAAAFAALAVLTGVVVTVADGRRPTWVAANYGSVARVVAGSPFPPLDETWWARVSSLPPLEQSQAVEAELRRRNPGWRAGLDTAEWRIEDRGVASATVRGVGLTDLTPLRVLPVLRVLNCNTAPTAPRPDGALCDLSPLTGLPLTRLQLAGNPVADLRPLAAMPLQWLDLDGTRVRDIAPLRGMPLLELNLPPVVSDLTPLAGSPLVNLHAPGPALAASVANVTTLRGVASLQTINGHVADPQLAFAEALPAVPRVGAAVTFAPVAGVERLAFSPDGQTLAASGRGTPTLLWDVAARRERHRLLESAAATTWAEDGRTLFTTTASGDAKLVRWDVATGRRAGEWRLASHTPALAAAPDRRSVVVGCGPPGSAPGSTVSQFRLPDGDSLTRLPMHDVGDVSRVTFSPDGRELAVTRATRVVIWDVESRFKVGEAPTGERILAVAWSPDRRRLAVGDTTGITVFDPADRQQAALPLRGAVVLALPPTARRLAEVHDGVAKAALAFTADNRLLAAGDGDTVYALDATTLRPVACYRGHTAAVRDLVVAPDGRSFATASQDGTIKLWPLDAPATKAVTP